MSRLNQILEEYYRIPVQKKEYGDNSFMVWLDPAELKSFYERHRDEVLTMDHIFLANSKDNSIWSDDAEFCRAILHWLWIQLDIDRQRQEEALVVWNEFTQRRSAIHIEEFTKVTLRDSFVNKQEGILTPSLPYEENLHVIFQAHMAFLLVKMKEYEKAIEENELIAKTHPTSRYTQQYANDQIQMIRAIIEGKLTVPETAAY